MEATIQSNKMDVDKEEARPNPEVSNLPQEILKWRMPEFPPILQGEDHRTLRRFQPIALQRQGQKDKELVEEPKSFIHRQEEGIGKDSRFGDRRPSGFYQLQSRSISVQRQAQRTSEEAERSQEPSRKGQRQRQLPLTLPTKVQDPQSGAFSCGQFLEYGQDSHQGESRINSWRLTSHRTAVTSRQRQLSHVSHENVTQSSNPFQHYSQCLVNFTSLASASPPNPPRCFACLRAGTTLQMRLRHCPPISVLTTPYAFTPPPLPSLCSRGALPTCSRHHLSLRSLKCPPNMLPTLLTILMLA
ncbi:hypothetical protein O181_120163, partial [Austropuccinia psidii MF-1]|nr:hypothetical protein [Austropuccinia psidii MF-1]